MGRNLTKTSVLSMSIAPWGLGADPQACQQPSRHDAAPSAEQTSPGRSGRQDPLDHVVGERLRTDAVRPHQRGQQRGEHRRVGGGGTEPSPAPGGRLGPEGAPEEGYRELNDRCADPASTSAMAPRRRAEAALPVVAVESPAKPGCRERAAISATGANRGAATGASRTSSTCPTRLSPCDRQSSRRRPARRRRPRHRQDNDHHRCREAPSDYVGSPMAKGHREGTIGEPHHRQPSG